LPVPDRGDSHTLALAGALDTPPHRARRRTGPTAAVSVEEDRPVGLVQHTYTRARVQLAVAVEGGQHPQHRDPMIGVAAKLGIQQEPGQALGVLALQLQALEGSG